MHDGQLTLGALWDGRATTFRVWAPHHSTLDLVLDREPDRPRALQRDACGCWSGTFTDARPGDRYRYRLNGTPEQTFPDPASRFQPEGVHGSSEIIDPAAYTWHDQAWRVPALRDLVFYELHVGTFTRAGTFRGACERLADLAALGVSAIELMPVGDFAGDRNWGYDVAAMFAPSRAYGRPDDLRALVDAAHARGIAVFLDVVYNHLGPDGAYLPAFSPQYFSQTHQNPWGASINLDGPGAAEVRRFFIENALHWVREYHVDGLRLDATHALIDTSAEHLLAELARTLPACAGRPVPLVAEDHRNLAQLITPRERQGTGLDGVWADDFHHEARVHTAHDDEGYYADYTGAIADLAATLRQGWFYTGQRTKTTGAPRGTDPTGLEPSRFVICLQNHDQVGNRADGARLHHEIDLPAFRALSALLLLAPQTPLLFMGQEWAASAPFLFFTDHEPALGEQITEGRRAEFRAFRAFADPVLRAAIPDPQSPGTFRRSQLDWDERQASPHRDILALYTRLLHLRRQLAPGHLGQGAFTATALDDHTVALILPAAVVVARMAGAGSVRLDRPLGPVMVTTEDEAVAADAQPIVVAGDAITFARPGAVVISTSLAAGGSITTKPSASDTGGSPHGDADH